MKISTAHVNNFVSTGIINWPIDMKTLSAQNHIVCNEVKWRKKTTALKDKEPSGNWN